MGFFAPWFLAGIAAVGLPVWLHLLRRHRAEPLRFSSLMFFERRTQSSIKHRRVQHLLLLALRLALLALLVLAFANPYITRPGGAGAGGRRRVVLAIDDSFSMRQGGALERAKRDALSVADRLQTGTRAEVIALDSQVRMLTQSVEDRQELRAAIGSISPSDSRSSYAELARAVRSIAQASREPVEVQLFSDIQKSSMPAAFADLRLPAGAQLVLHPTADARRANWAVEGVNAPRRLFGTNKGRVRATLAGYGTRAARREVSLVINNRVLETKAVEVPANGRAAVEFASVDPPYGLNRGEVRMSPADGLSEDDRYFFSIERAEARRVLFVHEAREPRGRLYFESALGSAAEGAFTLDAVTTEQAANISPKSYAAVVLSDVASLPEAFANSLRAFVRGGGGVLIALGPAAATRPRVPVFDEAIIEARYESRAGERFQAAGSVDAGHPSLRGANGWDGVKFYRVTRVEPGAAHVIARLADQTPLLLEKKLGEGRAMVLASTFDNVSNDLPLHAAFVPFAGESLRYLSGDDDRPSNVLVDAFLELRPAKDRAAAVEVLDTEGRRALSLTEATTAQTFRTTRAGFYEVRRGNGRNELVAVNPDRRESDLDIVPAETLALWRNTGNPGAQASVGANADEPRRQPLWPYLMALALAVALAESLVAGRHMSAAQGERKPEAAETRVMAARGGGR